MRKDYRNITFDTPEDRFFVWLPRLMFFAALVILFLAACGGAQ